MSTNLKYWLALSSVENLGSKRGRDLVVRFGSIQALFSASFRDLMSLPSIDLWLAQKIFEAKGKLDSFEVAADNLIRADRIKCICIEDEGYPKLLKLIDDPPLVLYKRGTLSNLNLPAVALVGTRKPSGAGSKAAEVLAEYFSDLGFTVVSGLASGIDASAHKGTLRSKGKTIAVLGCGLKLMYPRINIPLSEGITTKGALISELSPYEPVSNSSLIRRNRVISGLSLATIVVQANADRGSVHTARFATRQNRVLYACKVNGSNGALSLLLSFGAKLIESSPLEYEAVVKIAEDLRSQAATAQKPEKLSFQGELFGDT